MVSLQQQLAALATQVERWCESIPVDDQALRLTVEQHSPGNGSTYTRLRAPKGKQLPNGKRTMGLDEKQAAEWEEKIYARNQQAKLAKCLALIRQAADVTESVTWNFGEDAALLVNEPKKATTQQKKAKPVNAAKATKPKPKATIKYVFKDAKGATTINRKVHATSQKEPGYGRWYSPALCGERPKPGSWGWRTCHKSELSCPKCAIKVKQLT